MELTTPGATHQDASPYEPGNVVTPPHATRGKLSHARKVMGAIPESTLPGHRALHERVEAALQVCQETRDVEFKASCPWKDLRYAVTRTTLAMANLRDGGIVIVGVDERAGSWDLTGIADGDLATYDEDQINDFINKYASPPLRVQLVVVPHSERRFLVLRVPEFETSPVVCRADAAEESGLVRGAIFVRPIGKPETAKVRESSQLDDLLELASEKRTRRFLETASRVGLTPQSSSPTDVAAMFDRELDGL